MTFRDLLEQGEGKAYLVSKHNPTKVVEMDCMMRTFNTFKENFPNYRHCLGWWGYRDNMHEYVIARKSKAKDNVHRGGQPRFVNINNCGMFAYPTHEDLDNTRYNFYNSFLFLSKEDACDYVIDKTKHRKLELNAIINKINKFKFDIAE